MGRSTRTLVAGDGAQRYSEESSSQYLDMSMLPAIRAHNALNADQKFRWLARKIGLAMSTFEDAETSFLAFRPTCCRSAGSLEDGKHGHFRDVHDLQIWNHAAAAEEHLVGFQPARFLRVLTGRSVGSTEPQAHQSKNCQRTRPCDPGPLLARGASVEATRGAGVGVAHREGPLSVDQLEQRTTRMGAKQNGVLLAETRLAALGGQPAMRAVGSRMLFISEALFKGFGYQRSPAGECASGQVLEIGSPGTHPAQRDTRRRFDQQLVNCPMPAGPAHGMAG